MAACEAKRTTLGLSYADVARKVGVDSADARRALSLKEEPSARTRGALVEYFAVAEASDLNAREKELSNLIEAGSGLRKAADALERLVALRVSQDPPEV
jgi:transcriptional regulator with XRE-family HTH domain